MDSAYVLNDIRDPVTGKLVAKEGQQVTPALCKAARDVGLSYIEVAYTQEDESSLLDGIVNLVNK